MTAYYLVLSLALSAVLHLFCPVVLARETKSWQEDIDFLAKELPAKHVNLFHSTTEEEFVAKINALRAKLDELEDFQIEAGLSRIVASVQEGHTAIQPNARDLHALPVQFSFFKDGLFITRTTPEHKDAFGGKVAKLGALDIKEVARKTRPYFSHENIWQFKNQGARLMGRAEMLAVIGAWETVEGGSVTYEKDGKTTTIQTRSIPFDQLAGIEWVTRTGPAPLYTNKPQLDHWNDWLQDSGTLYFKYNRCRGAKAFRQLAGGTAGFIKQNDVKRIVIDLRDNGGGDSSIFRPFLQYLANHETLNHKDKMFAIIGRRTFSSGILNALELKEETNATLVGEPTGGRPSHYGDVRSLELPNSRLTVTYSTKFFERPALADQKALMPDINVEPTFQDWLDGKDPVLEAIIAPRR